MSNALKALRPAWERDADLTTELICHAMKGGDDALGHVLSVFSGTSHPPELSELLVQRFRPHTLRWWQEEPWRVSQWIYWAEHSSCLETLEKPLEDLTTFDSWLKYRAFESLITLHPSKAAEYSHQAAASWPSDWSSHFMPQSTLSRLVRANVESWLQRMREHLLKGNLNPKTMLRLARVLAPLLPPGQHNTFRKELERKFGGMHYFRFGDDGAVAQESVGCSDRCAQILYVTDGLALR
ncbi:hypothetical protein D7V80_12660 [Corallococcus sp. CA054B]|uniref:hypothetical protein n=1 Tax=Corallococcus sp. CA054B TaxID=2316734 RepID=UPI000EA206B8|nr:hypothetical protein [Corallococcus sp. CA054B]RKG68367.1 hypothetical protein D7V80_12660 [Corallococcus sp. CA054B]